MEGGPPPASWLMPTAQPMCDEQTPHSTMSLQSQLLTRSRALQDWRLRECVRPSIQGQACTAPPPRPPSPTVGHLHLTGCRTCVRLGLSEGYSAVLSRLESRVPSLTAHSALRHPWLAIWVYPEELFEPSAGEGG